MVDHQHSLLQHEVRKYQPKMATTIPKIALIFGLVLVAQYVSAAPTPEPSISCSRGCYGFNDGAYRSCFSGCCPNYFRYGGNCGSLNYGANTGCSFNSGFNNNCFGCPNSGCCVPIGACCYNPCGICCPNCCASSFCCDPCACLA